MNLLESYLKDQCPNGIIYTQDLDYTYFDYENYDEMEYDLDFLIETIFQNYKIISSQSETRRSQSTFREGLIQKYGKCIITGTHCLDELEAAHIIPYKEDKHNFFVSNGLLLKSNIHNTFDKYKWAINPDTFMIEVKNNIDVGEIKKYEGIKVELNYTDLLLVNNLKKRYQDYLKN